METLRISFVWLMWTPISQVLSDVLFWVSSVTWLWYPSVSVVWVPAAGVRGSCGCSWAAETEERDWEAEWTSSFTGPHHQTGGTGIYQLSFWQWSSSFCLFHKQHSALTTASSLPGEISTAGARPEPDVAGECSAETRQECEDLAERLATITHIAEQERMELQAQHQRRLAQTQQDRDREVERLETYRGRGLKDTTLENKRLWPCLYFLPKAQLFSLLVDKRMYVIFIFP